MLIEFSVANFRSFKEKQTLSLVASTKDKTNSENLIPAGKFSSLKVAAVYGANASGKSNLIKALAVARWFIANSATKMNQGDKIFGISPFRLDAELKNRPSSFELMFRSDGTRFEYGFSATSERVYDEWLMSYPSKGKARKIFDRHFDAESGQTKWDFKEPLMPERKLLTEKTRDNGLVLSRGAELNIEILNNVYRWFREDLWIFDLSQHSDFLIGNTGARMRGDQDFQNRLMQLLHGADFGIDSVNIIEHSQNIEDMPNEFKKRLSEKDRQAIDEAIKTISIKTIHHVSGSDENVEFDLEDESYGTQRFLGLVGPFLDAIEQGTVVIIDEFQCSMHPLLSRKLVELFQSPQINTTGAQLIFATHDTTLMDSKLLRRDQIWEVEKNRQGATELFSLYDFKTEDRPRNTTAFQRNYLAGHYGGVPRFGPAFEDLEIK